MANEFKIKNGLISDGDVVVTGSLTVTGTINMSGSIESAETASFAPSYTLTSSFNSYTSSASSSVGLLSSSVATTTSDLSSSIGNLSGSVATTTLNLSSSVSSSIGNLSGSVATTTSGLGGRITTIEGRGATTGSNTFIGSQVITGSLYITTDLIVQGSSSLQNITASAVSIGTNTVILNTDTPAVRFAGISVQDSGSNAGVTGSIFWDGLCNRWVYSNPSGIGYSGGMLLSGPRTSTLGTESPLTCNYIAKSGGGDHLYDSCVIDDGTTVCVNANLKGSGTIDGTIINSTSNAFRFSGNNAISLVALNTQNVVKINAAGYWGTQLVGANDKGILIDNVGNIGIGTTSTAIHANAGYSTLTIGGGNVNRGWLEIGILGACTNNIVGNISAFAGTNARVSEISFATEGAANLGNISFSTYCNGINTKLFINNSGISCFACTVCAPQFTGGVVCAVGGFNSRGLSTTWSSFNLFPDNPGGSGDQCKTVLAGSFVGCSTWGPQLRFSGPAAGFIDIGQDCNGGFVVETSDTPRLNITQGGMMGVNNPAPRTFLHIVGASCGSDIACGFGNPDTRGILHVQACSGIENSNVTVETAYGIGQFMQWSTNGMRIGHRILKGGGTGDVHITAGQDSVKLLIYTTGNIGAPSGSNIYAASDCRLKKNIRTISYGLCDVMKLQPKVFNWKDNFTPSENGKEMLGFVAQDIQTIIPEVVEQFSDGSDITFDCETIINPLRVNEKFIIPILTRAIQEQQCIIQCLTNRIVLLENK